MKLKRLLLVMLCVLLAFQFVACSDEEDEPSSSSAAPSEPSKPEPPPEFPVEVNGTVVAARPGRVVSLSPAITEKIFDLGLEDCVVGVSSIPEDEYEDYERCGTAQMPDVEMISKLDAHMVVSEIPLPDEDYEDLLRQEIDVVVIPHAESLDELWDAYIALCRMFEGEHAGQRMGEEFTGAVSAWLDEVRGESEAQEGAPAPALYIREMPFTVATGDSLENDLMEAIGCVNIAGEQTGWQYPEELAWGEGRADFESLQFMFFDQPTVSMKEHLEKSDFYWDLLATWEDWFYDLDYSVMERQSMRTFEQLLAMAEAVWPEADYPAWPPEIEHSLGDGAAISAIDDDPGEDDEDESEDDEGDLEEPPLTDEGEEDNSSKEEE